MKNIALILSLLFCVSNCPQVWGRPIQTVLILKQKGNLQSLLDQVLDKGSDHFARHFTPAEIAAQMALPDPDYHKVLASLKRRKFQIVHEDLTRNYLIVKSSVTTLEKTFGTKLVFTSSGKHYAVSAPVIPADLASVQDILNLDNRLTFVPSLKVHTGQSTNPPGYSPAYINSRYGFDLIHKQGYLGEGQIVGTVAFDSVDPNNVSTYFSQFNISPAPNIEVVPVNGNTVHIPCQTDLECHNEIENDVDLQMIGRIAPAAKMISFVGTTDDYLASWVAIFTTILDRGDIFAVNNSDDSGVDPVGSNAQGCEAKLAKSAWFRKMEPLFRRAVIQGVTIFSASGDNGSDNCGDETQGLDWPTSPYLVSSGGTDFTGATEVGWNGSGGGVSVIYPKPPWQFGTPFNMRGTPDISMYAGTDPGQAIFSTMQVGKPAIWMASGGTSLVSPSMVGLLALVNEARLSNGKETLPYVNPILYTMTPSDRADCFNDVVGGSNGFYTAAAGWDAVTGLGSPHADKLFQYLVNY